MMRIMLMGLGAAAVLVGAVPLTGALLPKRHVAMRSVRLGLSPDKVWAFLAEPGAPFGGTWTYVLASVADGGTTLTITEDGKVYNPVFRFVSRFVMGHTATLDTYLAALGVALGETATLRDA